MSFPPNLSGRRLRRGAVVAGAALLATAAMLFLRSPSPHAIAPTPNIGLAESPTERTVANEPPPTTVEHHIVAHGESAAVHTIPTAAIEQSPEPVFLAIADSAPPKKEHGSGGSKQPSPFSPPQDSTYNRGKRLRIGPATRLQHELEQHDSAWQAEQQRRGNVPESLMHRALIFTPEELKPTERQKMDRARDVSPGAPSDVMPNIPRAGISIPFSTRSLLGLDEDVSPKLSFPVQQPSHVIIMVYTVGGDTVATLFNGSYAPGRYSITWDFANDAGARVAPGDYVLEAVINNDARVKKRVVVQ